MYLAGKYALSKFQEKDTRLNNLLFGSEANNFLSPFRSSRYSLSAFKWHKSNIKNSLMKSSEIVLIFLPAFYLIIWLMKSLKNFEKISFLKIWQMVFFWGAKIYFGIFLPKWSIFRSVKIWFSQIMPFNSYHFHLM